MGTTAAPDTASGVRELISRLKAEGIEAGREQAEALLAEAHAEAGRIRAEAKEEAARLSQEAEARIARDTEAALASLKLAARDTVLEVRSRLTAALERHGRELAKAELADRDLLRALVLELAKAAGAEVAKTAGSVEVRVPQREMVELAQAIVGETVSEQHQGTLSKVALAASAGALRHGVSLVGDPEVGSGARVRLGASELEIDLGGEAIAALLSRYILPRYRAILDGAAG